jgi:hypothetical protein
VCQKRFRLKDFKKEKEYERLWNEFVFSKQTLRELSQVFPYTKKQLERIFEVIRLDKKIHQPRLAFLKAKRYGWTHPNPRYQAGSDNLEIQAIRLSKDLVFLGLPGEYLVEVGEKIRSESPFKNTIIIGYANGYFDYFPLQKDFKEHGYEVGRSIYGEGSTEKVMQVAIDLLRNLS